MNQWKLVPVEPTPEIREVIRNEQCVYQSEDDLYRAMLEAAPQPPKLTDERIMDIYAELVAEVAKGGSMFNFARAIEREILGGGHE